jgi:hypothetical protein
MAPDGYKAARSPQVRMASPLSPLSSLLGDKLDCSTHPQLWQSGAPVARYAGQSRRPGRSKSCSADSLNALGQRRLSTLTAPRYISPMCGDVGLSMSPFPFLPPSALLLEHRLIKTGLDFVRKSTTSLATSPAPILFEFVRTTCTAKLFKDS